MKKLFTILFVLSAYVSFGQAYIGQDGAIHPTGKFPVIFSNEAKGTIKRVKSLTDRDAIAQNLRDTGMLCWVTDSSRFYVLSGGTSNTRWINFSSATGGGTGIGNELDPIFTQSPSFTITNEKKAYWDLVGLMMRIDSAKKEMHDTAVAHDVIFDPNTFFYRNDTLSIIFPQDQTGGSNVTQEQIDLWNTILDTSLHPTADTIRAWIARVRLRDTTYLDKNGFSGFGETANDPVKNKAFTSFQKINDSTIRFWTGDSLFQDLAIKDIVGGNSSDTAVQSIAMLSDSTGFRVFKKTGFYDVFLKGTRSGSGGGSGTVTNVSVVNTFGVSGTVTNPTTTPALTLAIDTTKFVTTHQLNLVVNSFADSLSTIRNYIDTNISNIQNQVTNITNGSAGTVKSVSVVNTFGLTGTVTNPTTTPAITITIDSTKYSTVSNVNTSIKNVVNNFGDSIANIKNIITGSVSKVLPYNADSSFYLGGDTTLHRLPVAPATSDSIDYAFTAMTTVYNEAGPGEYVSSAHGLTANKDNFNFPFRQLKALDIGTWTDGDYVSFNNATIASSTNFTFLRAFIRLKSVVPVSGTISFAFYYNGIQVSKTISCVNYGIDKSKVGVYQNVSIPFSAFGFTANNFDELRLKFGGTQSDGIYMDLVQFQNASVFENTFITDLFKKPLTDSVFKVVGGINVYAFRDSGGGTSIDTNKFISNVTSPNDSTLNFIKGDTVIPVIIRGSSGSVTSFNSRIGAIIPQSSDYSSYYAALSHTHTESQVTNLVTDLAGKEFVISAPNTTNRYWNGYKAFVSLNTDSISEGSTNKFYTDTKARAAISLTTTGTSGAATYNSTTGVLNIPSYTGGSGSSGWGLSGNVVTDPDFLGSTNLRSVRFKANNSPVGAIDSLGNWIIGTQLLNNGVKLYVEGSMKTLSAINSGTTMTAGTSFLANGAITGGTTINALSGLYSGYNIASVKPNGSAALDIVSSTQGAIFPRIASHNSILKIVKSITITNGGSGYSTAPTATIAGAPLSGVVVSISGGAVTGVTWTGSGSASVAPTVTFSGGGGTGATATSTIDWAEGVTYYNTTTHGLEYYNGTEWRAISSTTAP